MSAVEPTLAAPLYLIALACIATALPSTALAGGRYDLEICTPSSAKVHGDGIDTPEEPGTINLTQSGCLDEANGEFALPTSGFALNMGDIVGAKGWRLTAVPRTFIHEVRANRRFSSFATWFESNLRWEAFSSAPGEPRLELVDAMTPPPAAGAITWLVDSTTLTTRLSCPNPPCKSGNQRAEASFGEIVATIEDERPPTARLALGADQLKGTVSIPYTAEDVGSGVRTTQLQVDGKTIASASDSNNGKCSVPFKVMVPCKSKIDSTFSLNTTKLADGEHSLAIGATDAANQLAFSQPLTITVGNTLKTATTPQTKIKKHPPKQGRARQVKFTFVANQKGSSYQCKLDKKPFKACRSPFKKKLKPGRHVFRVKAVNPTGTADPTPAKFRFRILR